MAISKVSPFLLAKIRPPRFKKPERSGAFGAAACVFKPDKAKSPERSEDLQR